MSESTTTTTPRSIWGNGLRMLAGLFRGHLDQKVDKETGKGLSTNDYTTAEKEKLAGITTATQSAEGLMSAADKTKLDGMTKTEDLGVTENGYVLDAKAGKTLNDKIGTLTSLSTTNKGS